LANAFSAGALHPATKQRAAVATGDRRGLRIETGEPAAIAENQAAGGNRRSEKESPALHGFSQTLAKRD
jgi:hypothetical protein